TTGSRCGRSTRTERSRMQIGRSQGSPKGLRYRVGIIVGAVAVLVAILVAQAFRPAIEPAVAQSPTFGIGRAPTAEELKAIDIDGEDDVLDETTLPRVKMPNRDGFVGDPRPDIPVKKK